MSPTIDGTGGKLGMKNLLFTRLPNSSNVFAKIRTAAMAATFASASVISSGAFAAVSDASIYNYQPGAKGHSFDAVYDINNGYKGDAKLASGVKFAEFEVKPAVLNLTYLYGFRPNMALGLGLSFGNLTTTTKIASTLISSDSKQDGLGDLMFKFKGITAASGFRIRYGGDLGYSLAKAKDGVANNPGNRASGGISLTPFVAAEMPMDVVVLGLGLRYSYLLDRKVDTTPESTRTGGNVLELKPYLEAPFDGGAAGVYAVYTTTDELKQATGGATTNTNPSNTLLGFGGNVNYNFTPSLSALSNLEFQSYTYNSTSASASTTASGVLIDIGARLTF
jgi:hypothetical protein